MTSLLYLVGAFFLVLTNAFFVASEFAIVKMRPTRLEQLVRGGDARAKLALKIAGRLDEYLSANQLGMTIASLGLGWIGEPAIADVLVPHLERLGRWANVSAHAIAFSIAFIAHHLGAHRGRRARPEALAIQRGRRRSRSSRRVRSTPSSSWRGRSSGS